MKTSYSRYLRRFAQELATIAQATEALDSLKTLDPHMTDAEKDATYTIGAYLQKARNNVAACIVNVSNLPDF